MSNSRDEGPLGRLRPPRRMPQALGRLHSSERGSALAIVVFLGAGLVIVAAVLATRSVTSINLANSDRSYEAAMQVAESGLATSLRQIQVNATWNTGDLAATLADKDAVVAVARAKPDADVIDTPIGEAVVMKPVDADVLYAVGFSPDRTDPNAITRVVEAELGLTGWSIDAAILTGGNLRIEARKSKKHVDVVGSADWAHANGKMFFKSTKHTNDVDGCLTAFGGVLVKSAKSPGDGEDPYSNLGTPECPPQNQVPYLDIPEINPMNVHYKATYEICPDGTLRYGPASGQPGASPAGTPCVGAHVVEDLLVKDWQDPGKRVEINKDSAEGTYFFYERSVKIKYDNKGETRNVTVITTKPGNDLTCQKPGKREWNGDVILETDGVEVWPHSNGDPYLIVASGDVHIKIKDKHSGEVHGLIFSHEQVKLESTDVDLAELKGGIQGAVVAEHACDTEDSLLKDGWSILKHGDVYYDGDSFVWDFGVYANGVISMSEL